jgi:hypothetical protein
MVFGRQSIRESRTKEGSVHRSIFPLVGRDRPTLKNRVLQEQVELRTKVDHAMFADLRESLKGKRSNSEEVSNVDSQMRNPVCPRICATTAGDKG